ncbi:unnamed protein product [Urochloa humidicola]
MAEEKQQKRQEKEEAASGGDAALCAGGGCRPYGSTPMCSACYAEKVAKPMEELERVLAEIRRVNAGKKVGRDRIVRDIPAAGVIKKVSRSRDCC